jgi:S-adenosylmethionine:tRNA ribosyltransferase-isomerase
MIASAPPPRRETLAARSSDTRSGTKCGTCDNPATRALEPIAFTLPRALEARVPPEARGLARDEVRLLVSGIRSGRVAHATFCALPRFLRAGDVVVVNASATLPAAVAAVRVNGQGGNGEHVVVHFSSPVPGHGGRAARSRWLVELRRDAGKGTVPLLDAAPRDRLVLSGGATLTLVEPFAAIMRGTRLWVAAVESTVDVLTLLAHVGRPIRYAYLDGAWPLDDYQTMFASEPGSAEMPSAGRPFTPRVVRRLEAKGVRVVRIVLHTGVASLEADEPPYPERYRVPADTAHAIAAARAAGGRVVAAGTTVVRALETVAHPDGTVEPGAGWTDVVVTPARGLFAVDAILTGFHEPRASHLAMLETLAGRTHLVRAYDEALHRGYLWHEFGDVHLILP